ncbi:MAG TPA: hypothetical protein VMD77_12445 [Candidatus Baltobacteraceae bacterium]|jgi:hypothetical protein|nr:hypothetical protein [Candidatus Baltobacteraceae bacterium]
MRHLGFVLGAIVLFAASASAQSSPPLSPATVALTTDNIAFEAPDAPIASTLYAAASTPAAPAALSLDLPAKPEPAPAPVQSVYQTYNWQLYVGYTFFRFYAYPKLTNNMNGLNISAVYYPGGRWIGVDGEVVGTFGSIPTCTTKFVMAAGGARVRWLTTHSIEAWAHGLVGYSNFLPQTALGTHSAFAFETGAGVDLNVRQQRWALRLAGDLVGTRFYSTGQYSPKVSAGIVIKF